MGSVRIQCPHCGPAVHVEFGVPNHPLVAQVSMVVQCPQCGKFIWFLGLKGLSKPFVIPLDSMEMRGSIVDQLVHMAAELEKSIRTKPTTSSSDVPDDTDTRVPVEIFSGRPTQLDSSPNNDSEYSVELACPGCGQRYSFAGDDTPPLYILLPDGATCKRCSMRLPSLWYKKEGNYYEPLPETSATSRQISLKPISGFELAVFAALLKGGVRDTQDLEEV